MNKLDNFDEYLKEYFNKWANIHYTDAGLFEYLVNILHIIIILWVITGPFLPHKIIPFYIISVLLMILSWFIVGKCILDIPFGKGQFFPISFRMKMTGIGIILIITVINYLFPKYSLFNAVFSTITYLNNNYN